MANRFKAFISYSHASDSRLAPALQRALERFLKPWYRQRAIELFRDQTDLSISPELWPRVEEAMDDSEFLLLLASEGAAKSKWVKKEVLHWLSGHSSDTVLIVLTSGVIQWDEATNDFDWKITTAIPPGLAGAFKSEPLYCDFRWAEQRDFQALPEKQYEDAIGTIAATLHGLAKSTVVGLHLAEHRRTLRWAWSAAITLAALAIGALTAAYFAHTQSLLAERNERTAIAETRVAEQQRDRAISRQLAGEALRLVDHPSPEVRERGLLLAIESSARADIPEASQALSALTPIVPSARIIAPNAGVVDFSPDGEFIAVGSGRNLLIWSLRERRNLRSIPFAADIAALRFFSDGLRIAVGTFEKHGFRVIRWTNGKELGSKAIDLPLEHLALSPSERFVAATDFRGNGVVWDLANEMAARPFQTATSPFVFSFDSRSILLSANDSTESLTSFRLPDNRMSPIRCTPVSHDVLRQLGIADTVLQIPCGGRGRLKAIDVSPNGKWIALARANGVEIIDQLGQIVFDRSESVLADVTSLSFSRDSRMLAIGRSTGEVTVADASYWRLPIKDGGEVELRHPGPVSEARFSPDGRWLATTSPKDSLVRLWWMPKSIATWSLALGRAIEQVGYSADGKFVAVVQDSNSRRDGLAADAVVRVFDAETGREFPALAAFNRVRCVALSHDGHLIAIGTVDGVLTVAETRTGRTRFTVKNSTIVNSAVWSDDSRLTVAGGGFVRVWDTTGSRPLASLSVSHPVYSIAISKGGQWVAFAGGNVVERWQIGEAHQTVLIQAAGARQIAISRNERYVASVGDDGVILVWDALEGHATRHSILNEFVNDVGFAIGGDSLYASSKREVTVFSMPTMERLRRLPTLAAASAMAVSPDGRHVVVGTALGELAQLVVQPLGEARRAACEVASRNLDQMEWDDFLPALPYRVQCASKPGRVGSHARSP